MKIVKQLGLLVSAFFLLSSVGANAAVPATAPATTPTPIRVAVVNVQQVLQQSPRVAALSKKLEAQFKDRQTKINDEQKSLQDELDAFKRDSASMSAKDRDAQQKKIADDRSNLVKEAVAYQQDLQKEQNKIMQGILADLNTIVSGIARQQNYSLVLDSQAVVFATDGTDLTKEVSKQFNAKNS